MSEFSCQYAGGESNIEKFGGNSNWRGPIWLCSKYAIKSPSNTVVFTVFI